MKVEEWGRTTDRRQQKTTTTTATSGDKCPSLFTSAKECNFFRHASVSPAPAEPRAIVYYIYTYIELLCTAQWSLGQLQIRLLYGYANTEYWIDWISTSYRSIVLSSSVCGLPVLIRPGLSIASTTHYGVDMAHYPGQRRNAIASSIATSKQWSCLVYQPTSSWLCIFARVALFSVVRFWEGSSSRVFE